MATNDIRAVVDWLVDGARSTMHAHEVLAELCERLLGCGIPLWRVAVFVRTLHPYIMGRRFVWRPGTEVEVLDAPFDLLESAEFRDSPVAKVYASGTPLRRRLADADCPMDFPMLAELRNNGVTDYLASPLLFTDGEIHLATWTTRQPGGFTDAQVKAIESIVAPLARVAEGARAAANRGQSARYVCRQQCRRAHSRRPDSAGSRRSGPCGNLAVRYARLHLVGGPRARADVS